MKLLIGLIPWLTLGTALARPGVPTPVFYVGADLTDDLPDDTAFSDCVQKAISASGACRIPSGTLILSRYTPELRQSTVDPSTVLLDLKGATIEGAGETTTILGRSEAGFDVFALNAVKNLTLRNFTIRSIKTTGSTHHGCNGVSITNGSQNIRIENVVVRELPYVDKGTNLDGGKAFTVQQGSVVPSRITNIVISNCRSLDNPYGFGMDSPGTGSYFPGTITVQNNRIERAAVGIALSLSATPAVGAIEGLSVSVTGNTIVDSTGGIYLSRGSGYRITGNTIEGDPERGIAAPNANPDYAVQVAAVYGFILQNNSIRLTRVVAPFLIGAANPGASVSGALTGNRFSGDADYGVQVLVWRGLGVQSSRFLSNSFSGVGTSYDPLLGTKEWKNTVR